MTDTKEEETFESEINSIKFNSFGKVYIDEFKINKLKQLHDKKIEQRTQDTSRTMESLFKTILGDKTEQINILKKKLIAYEKGLLLSNIDEINQLEKDIYKVFSDELIKRREEKDKEISEIEKCWKNNELSLQNDINKLQAENEKLKRLKEEYRQKLIDTDTDYFDRG